MSNNGRFPPIAEVSAGGIKSNTTGHLGSSNSDSLPRMTPKQGAYSEPVYSHGKSAGKENVMVVGTSQNTEQGELPEDWTQMRVNVAQEDDSHRTKLEWENQIAKHILSMFATTHAVKNISEGTALLDFVDVDKTAVKTSNAHILIQETNSIDLLHTRPPRPPGNSNSENKDTNRNADDGNNCQEQRKTKKKIKKTKKKLASTEPNNTKEGGTSHTKGMPESHYSIAERVILRVHAEAEAAERALGKSKEKDKYRISNTIKLKDGQEIVVRGTPRCYPIWFVSTGDVYADWTSLPGGVKLQAHLNVLYEQQKYQDYLGIVETVITELWRKKKYGEEEFTLGSFGHSAAVTATASGANTGGTNTGANTARSHASQHSSRRSSHSGGNANMGSGAHRTGRKSTSGGGAGPGNRYASTGDNSPGGEDMHFGNAIVWEDAGEEGLIPKVVGSDSPVNSRGAARARSHSRGTASSPEMLPTMRGGTLTGADQHAGTVLDAEQQVTGEALVALWQQLIMACIAMGILFLERKRPDQAMLLFKRAEEWAANDEIVTSKKTRKVLKAHVRDAISYYFFKRKKSIAALGYSEQAMALYEDTDNLDGIAVCMLHVAAVHSQLGEFKEAHKVRYLLYASVAYPIYYITV